MRLNPEARRVHCEPLECRRLLSFGPAASYPTAPAPQSVVTGDFNRDGRPDLAVANPTGTVSVLLGNANGTFQPARNSPAIYSYPFQPTLAAGDLNRDGKLDLVTSGPSLLLGNGDGTFLAPAQIPVDLLSFFALTPISVAVGDINGDGKPDVALASIDYPGDDDTGEAFDHVVLGNGDGSFRPAVSRAVAELPEEARVAVADFNGDGKSDVATAVAAYSQMFVTLSLGTGTGVGKPTYFNFRDPDFEIWSMAAGDLNGDGKVDLVTVGRYVNVLLGTGTGSFQAPQHYSGGSVQNSSVAVADFDGDGKIDLAMGHFDTGTVSVLPGTGGGTFGPAVSAAVARLGRW